jgi:cell division septation protein DedD
MKKIIYIFLPIITLLLTSCTQQINHHPRHPNYSIKKPKVIYTPSKKNLDKMVKKLQGTPYVWAEEGPNKFDCSGFTYYLYGSMGINIPRVASKQARNGKRIGINELEYGDLIFFATSRRHRRRITHVGMYLGDGWFTHASTVKNEVIYSNLYTSPYYKKRLRVCRRYLPSKPTVHIAKAAPWKTKEVIPEIKKPEPVAEKQSIAEEETKVQTEQPISIKEKTITTNKAIVIKAPMQEIEPTSKMGAFYVQVGSFAGKPKNSLLGKIRSNGFKYKIIKFPKAGRSVSKLLIGPYETRNSAIKVLPKVKREIQQSAFIAEIR